MKKCELLYKECIVKEVVHVFVKPKNSTCICQTKKYMYLSGKKT